MTDLDTLNCFLEVQLPPGSLGGVRLIQPDDDRHLTSLEAEGLARAVPAVRRASGAGRALARSLCARLGSPVTEILRSPQRDPLWPPGLVGSIAHDAQCVAAVVAPSPPLSGIGVDIEPAEPLPAGVCELVASSGEIAAFADLPAAHKAIFSIKEAVFKAVYPADRQFLDFHSVVVARLTATATTGYGRVVHWRVLTVPRVLAIAWW